METTESADEYQIRKMAREIKQLKDERQILLKEIAQLRRDLYEENQRYERVRIEKLHADIKAR